jgi:hypothetical protein
MPTVLVNIFVLERHFGRPKALEDKTKYFQFS